MSSILKALKKLENETSVKSDTGSSLLQFYTKKPIKNRIKRDRLSNNRLLVIFTTLILLVASGLILTFGPWKKQPAPPKTTDRNSELIPVIPAPTKTKTPALKPETPTAINDSETFDPMNPVVEKPALPAQKSKTKEQELFPKTAADTTEKAGVVEEKSVLQQTIKKSPLISGNEQASEQKEDNTRFASIPIKQSSESMLELQAIAWSRQPEKRMAVINGHIVHESGSVEKATVKHIGKNDVVFMKEGETWRQLFRY